MILMAYQLQPFQLAGAPPGPAAAAANAPSLSTALEEQLGLKLQATSGPVDVLAIDSIERAKTEYNVRASAFSILGSCSGSILIRAVRVAAERRMKEPNLNTNREQRTEKHEHV
ncbi:MAG TPA: DUF3738 domain-containing protein [Vicinamibacterales bacterium]|nr:DUF3738 domain-containing protein [Vicinamibacterales bacterium]